MGIAKEAIQNLKQNGVNADLVEVEVGDLKLPQIQGDQGVQRYVTAAEAGSAAVRDVQYQMGPHQLPIDVQDYIANGARGSYIGPSTEEKQNFTTQEDETRIYTSGGNSALLTDDIILLETEGMVPKELQYFLPQEDPTTSGYESNPEIPDNQTTTSGYESNPEIPETLTTTSGYESNPEIPETLTTISGYESNPEIPDTQTTTSGYESNHEIPDTQTTTTSELKNIDNNLTTGNQVGGGKQQPLLNKDQKINEYLLSQIQSPIDHIDYIDWDNLDLVMK